LRAQGKSAEVEVNGRQQAEKCEETLHPPLRRRACAARLRARRIFSLRGHWGSNGTAPRTRGG
jgi:hypothetical protein